MGSARGAGHGWPGQAGAHPLADKPDLPLEELLARGEAGDDPARKLERTKLALLHEVSADRDVDRARGREARMAELVALGVEAGDVLVGVGHLFCDTIGRAREWGSARRAARGSLARVTSGDAGETSVRSALARAARHRSVRRAWRGSAGAVRTHLG